MSIAVAKGSSSVTPRASWKVLVSLHNLVKLPPELVSLNQHRGTAFSVTATAQDVGRNPAAHCPQPAAYFGVDDVVTQIPDFHEVRLDSDEAKHRSASVEWELSEPNVTVVITVRESTDEPTASRVLATSEPFTVNIEDIVMKKKLHTRVIGTTIGCVGISFAVAPSDAGGYKRRLEAFLSTYNPQGLRLVPSVVEAISELETFTKLYRKYGICDYETRVTDFFEIYGREYIGQIADLLGEWENREEELMRSLILDNGPEMADVDVLARLDAYTRRYPPSEGSPLAQKIAETAKSDALGRAATIAAASPLFKQLVEEFGPEPDPRTYLFPPTKYVPRGYVVASASANRGAIEYSVLPRSAAPATSETGSPGAVPSWRSAIQPLAAATRSPMGLLRGANAGEGASKLSDGHKYGAVPGEPAVPDNRGARQSVWSGQEASSRRRLSPRGTEKTPDRTPATGAAPPFLQQHHVTPQRGRGESAPSPSLIGRSAMVENIAELWERLTTDLSTHGRLISDVFYMDEPTLTQLVATTLGYDAGDVSAIIYEWKRRLQAAVHEEPLSQGDAYLDAAKKEATDLAGLSPLNIQFIAASSVSNAEHSAAFATHMRQLKQQATERLILVGDYHKLLHFVRHGVSPKQLAPSPAVVFYRRPFDSWSAAKTVSILVCDVSIGRPFVGAAGVRAPQEATSDFLAEWDCCVFSDPAGGQAVATYYPQQVLPRYLFQCTVDINVLPCAAHPTRAVEFYVVDTNTFACSWCVVLGQYKGLEVLTLDDASVQARSQLSEVRRGAQRVLAELTALDAEMNREEAAIAIAPSRTWAENEAQRIRREAEERVAALFKEVELQEQAQRDRLRINRQGVELVRESANKLGRMVEVGLKASQPSQTIATLQKVAKENDLEAMNERTEQLRLDIFAAAERQAQPPPVQQPPTPTATGGIAPSAWRSGRTLQDHDPPTAAATSQLSIRGGSRSASSKAGYTSLAQPPLAARDSDDPAVHRSDLTPRGPYGQSGPAVDGGGEPSSLYAKYLSIQRNGNRTHSTATATDRSNVSVGPHGTLDRSPAHHVGQQQQHHTANPQPRSVSVHSTRSTRAKQNGQLSLHNDRITQEDVEAELRRAKERMTRGWALFRQGDRAGAKRLWEEVYAQHGDDALGSRAMAYVAEAVDRNYDAAANWYQRSLAIDPYDCMTLYNYGVLLEALLGKKPDALQLFERAQELGDATAGRRAQQLREVLEGEQR